jgi:hypothetical protein
MLSEELSFSAASMEVFEIQCIAFSLPTRFDLALQLNCVQNGKLSSWILSQEALSNTSHFSIRSKADKGFLFLQGSEPKRSSYLTD